MRLPVIVALLVFTALAVIALLAMLTPGTTRGAGQQYTTFAGTAAAGDNVVINYNAQTQKVDLYFYKIPLNPTYCPGQTMDLFLPDVTVDQGSFDQYDGVQGANGFYSTNAHGSPVVSGTIYVAQDQLYTCANSISYSASTNVVLGGDTNCGWEDPFQLDGAGIAVPQGQTPSPTPNPGPAKNPTKAITVGDALEVLKWVAGFAEDSPVNCPKIGDLLAIILPGPGPSPTPAPVPIPWGDVNCNSHVSDQDVLDMLSYLAGVPQPSPGSGCIKVGQFYLLDK